jgi:hypothetical protein
MMLNSPRLATITDTFEPLKEDLQNIKRLIREYSRIPPFSGQKIIFAVFKIPDVKKIQESFNNYRAIYSRAFEHANALADAHNAAELKDINSRLQAKNKQMAANFAELKKQQQEAAKIQKDNNTKVDRVLKLLEKMAVSGHPITPGQPAAKLEWEDELVASGLKREEAKKIMGPLIWTASQAQKGQDVPQIKVGNTAPNNQGGHTDGQLRRHLSQNSVKKDQGLKAFGKPRSVSQSRDKDAEKPINKSPSGEKSKAHSSSPSPVKGNLNPPSPGPSSDNKRPSSPKKQGTRDTSHIWILCVDRTNGCKTPSSSCLSDIKIQQLT